MSRHFTEMVSGCSITKSCTAAAADSSKIRTSIDPLGPPVPGIPVSPAPTMHRSSFSPQTPAEHPAIDKDEDGATETEELRGLMQRSEIEFYVLPEEENRVTARTSSR